MVMIAYPSASAGRTRSITVLIESPHQTIGFLMSWEHSDAYSEGEFAIYASVNIGSIKPDEAHIYRTNRAAVNYTYDPRGTVRYQDVQITIKTYFYTSPERVMRIDRVDYVSFSPLYKVTVKSSIGETEGSGYYPAGALLTPKSNVSEARYDKMMYRLIKWVVRVAGDEPYYIEDGQQVEVKQVTEIEAICSKYYLVEVFSQYGYVRGGGWYAEGDVANFDIEPAILRINETSEAVFSCWEVNGVPINQSYVVVDGPKTVVATWSIRRLSSRGPEHPRNDENTPVHSDSNSANKVANVSGIEWCEDEELPMEMRLVSQVKVIAVSPFGRVRGTGTYVKGTPVFVSVTPTSFLVAGAVRLSFSGWVNLTSSEVVAEEFNLTFIAERDELLQAVWTLQYFVNGSWHNWDEVVELSPPEVEYISNRTRKLFSGFWRKWPSEIIRSNRVSLPACEAILLEPIMEVQHELAVSVDGVEGTLPIQIRVGDVPLVLNVTGRGHLWVKEGEEVILVPPENFGNFTLISISGENVSSIKLYVKSPETVDILYGSATSSYVTESPRDQLNRILMAMAILASIVTSSVFMVLRRQRALSLNEFKRILRGESELPGHACVDSTMLEFLKREDKELYTRALLMMSSGKLKIKPRS